jgi:hypothetical protein
VLVTSLFAMTFVLCAVLEVVGQIPPLSNPSTVAPPVWSRVLKMPDGRTFVSDGGIAIDAAIAKPEALPPTVAADQSATLLAGYLTAVYEQEIGLSDLGLGSLKNTFVTPSGVVLNGNYVNFLRRTLSPASVRLRVKDDTTPVAIVVDGKPVGVLMPVRR